MSPRSLGAAVRTAVAHPTRLVAAGLAALLVVLVAVAGVGLWRRYGEQPQQTLHARFDETPGLYVGNAVAVLGVPEGQITGIAAHGSYVEVTMTLPRSIKVPAQASAVVAAPNPVTDRTVEVYPAWTGGPTMRDGATIPLNRTAVPMGIDQIFGNLDQLAKALGPAGANRNGALSSVIRSVATLSKGTGARVNATLKAISLALPAFAQNPGQLERLLTQLDSLTSALAQHDSTLDSVYGTVATATSQLAGERTTIASSIVDLQAALTQVTSFVRTNRSTLASTLKHLLTTSKALVSDQAAVGTTFSTAALGFQNANRLIVPNQPCPGDTKKRCSVAFGRVNLPLGATSITPMYCADLFTTFFPFLATVPGVSSINDKLKAIPKPTPLNSACIAQHALVDGYGASSPGAAKQPDLGLSRFLK